MVFNLFPSRKAQGMSLNVVVIAVIAIAIIVVIIIIVASKTGMFSKAAASCEAKGGGARCMDADAEGAECDGILYRTGTDCVKRVETEGVAGPHCCVPMGG